MIAFPVRLNFETRQTIGRQLLTSILDPRLGKTCLSFDAVSKWYGPVIGVNQVSLNIAEGTGRIGADVMLSRLCRPR